MVAFLHDRDRVRHRQAPRGRARPARLRHYCAGTRRGRQQGDVVQAGRARPNRARRPRGLPCPAGAGRPLRPLPEFRFCNDFRSPSEFQPCGTPTASTAFRIPVLQRLSLAESEDCNESGPLGPQKPLQTADSENAGFPRCPYPLQTADSASAADAPKQPIRCNSPFRQAPSSGVGRHACGRRAVVRSNAPIAARSCEKRGFRHEPPCVRTPSGLPRNPPTTRSCI